MPDSPLLERAADFIWRNARLLDRHLFAYLYRDGPREGVLDALHAYHNGDGGFGHALEPDKRTPASQPIDVQVAFEVMDVVGLDATMAGQACDFLASVGEPNGSVACVLTGVNRYPHAPWWRLEGEPRGGINPTGAIAGLLLRQRFDHRWLRSATAYSWSVCEESDTVEPHDLACILTFLQNAPDRPRAVRAFERVSRNMLGAGVVEMDPAASGYVKKVLEWAPTPGSLCRPLFTRETVDAHLAALAAAQCDDGGWPITWPALSPACELEWRGHMTTRALRTLDAYGRLDR